MASKTGLRRSRTPRFMAQEQSTGISVRVMTREPSRAKIVVSAIGAKSCPDAPESA